MVSHRDTTQDNLKRSDSTTRQQVYRIERVVVEIINCLSIVVSFGVVFPPLAVIGCAAVLSITYFNQLLVGRFVYSHRGKADSIALLEGLFRDCKPLEEMFMFGVWFVVPFVVIFYALLVFDTLGDAVGWKLALWAPILVCCFPVTLRLCFVIRRKWHDNGAKEQRVKGDNTRVSEVSMGVIHSDNDDDCENIVVVASDIEKS